MFDLRSNTLFAITTAVPENVDSFHDFKQTQLAQEDVRGGKYPISSAIIGVGDWRVKEREFYSWGKNIVTNEIDILLFFRDPIFHTEYTIDTELSIALSKNELSSDDTLITELRESEQSVQIEDGIFMKRWILEVTALETTN